MSNFKVLWADDEIHLLKPHILFLTQKGYELTTVNNGNEAIDLIEKQQFDIILLDENMPGLSGLETLSKIKVIKPNLPVIMITKSEEEHIMEDAIGSQIADYLIKPVNPNQILLALKKNLDNKKLVGQKITTDYRMEFSQIGMMLGDRLDINQWKEVYKKLVYWELELEKSTEKNMAEILDMQKKEANLQFSKFIEKNYLNWLNQTSGEKPVMSHTLFKDKIAPEISNENKTVLLVIDNLRYDQWKVIQPVVEEFYRVTKEEIYYSILPTATQYARNALFAGLMPAEIEKKYPQYWSNEEDEGSKNQHEEALLNENLKRLGKNVKTNFTKIVANYFGKRIAETVPNLLQSDFICIVYNFVDMLSHARTDMEVIRELADDEPAYRSITLSWLKNSPLYEILRALATKKVKLIITTDHGTIKVSDATKIAGDKSTNTNLRFKTGKSLDWNDKDVMVIKNPSQAYLPKNHPSSCYVFAKESKFFAYPNNYNHYVNYYKNTFQHGGISLEEVLIPFVVLESK